MQPSQADGSAQKQPWRLMPQIGDVAQAALHSLSPFVAGVYECSTNKLERFSTSHTVSFEVGMPDF